MSEVSTSTIDAFINALQLSINSQISDWKGEKNNNLISIIFGNVEKNDTGLKLFEELKLGSWNKNKTIYKIEQIDAVDINTLINFLLLSRLQYENIVKIAELEAVYRQFAQKMGIEVLKSVIAEVSSIEDAVTKIFSVVEKKNMTLREISEKTGLTQTSISNFKAGNDIKLSNLIKIAKAVGLSLKIESK